MARVLERGEIRFKPIANVDGEPRYHVRLRPADKTVERDLVFGRREAPDAGAGLERTWALVEAVADHLPADEPATRGSYIIAAHGAHTHLAFTLAPDGPQASYLVSVKNPEPLGARFVPLDPPDFLDRVGAELVLVGAPEDVWEELGIPLEPPEAPAP